MRSSEYQVASLDQDETGIGYRAIEMANRLVNRKPLTPKDVIVPFEVVNQESLEEYEMSIKILKE